jgi:hypothetical protein
MSVTDLELVIFIFAIMMFGSIILALMYNIFKLIFDKFNELRKRL